MSFLNNINILVTRPAHQSEHLCALIKAQGGQPIRLPVIEILEIEDKSTLLDCCAHLDSVNIAIFVSTNAVENTLPTLLTQRNLPPHLQIVAVGKRTAERLKAWGISALCPAPPFNSELMLEMPSLQTEIIQGKKIIIFRGEGGRELLAETLRQRGAMVDYVNVYRRVQPTTPERINEPIDIITVTSREGLRNLFSMLAGPAWLYHTPWVIMSDRILTEIQRIGIRSPIFVASTASDEGLLAAILQAQSTIKK